MKKNSARMMLPLCTALILILGAVMPRLAAAVLDRHLVSEVQTLENTAVSLSMEQETDRFSRLCLFQELIRNNNYAVPLPEGYHMTKDEVRAAAKTLAGMGYERDFEEFVPVLLAGNDPSQELSGIFWECTTTHDNGEMEMVWVDDQSGLIVAGMLRLDLPSLSYGQVGALAKLDAVARYEDFCRDNYAVEQVSSSEETESLYKVWLTQNGKTCEISLLFGGNWLHFNL